MRLRSRHRARSGLPHRLTGVIAAALVALVAVVGPFALTSSADEVTELRNGVPTGEEVRSRLVELSGQRDQLLAELSAAEADLAATLDARRGFDDEQRRLAAQIEAAADHLRKVAVRVLISGGAAGELDMLLGSADVADLAWRRHLLHNHAESSQVALDRLERLRGQADEEVRASIEQADVLRRRIDDLGARIDDVEPAIAELRDLEPLADAWDRAAIAIAEGRYGIAPADKWAKLRFCESSDNYRAISDSGKYRGAYQFDYATWATVGGTGDPAAAPPAEQDARARELYARRGDEPWPECGAYLR